jgi:hypothetical protein
MNPPVVAGGNLVSIIGTGFGTRDYTLSASFGSTVCDFVAFTSDATNGGYLQRLRFKALGTNVATVARIYYNNGDSNLLGQLAAPTGLSGTASSSGGTLLSGSFFAKVVTVDQWNGKSVASSESSSVSVTGPTGSITWNWNAVTGAKSYRIYVGPVTGGQLTYFTTTTNSYTQTAPTGTNDTLTSGISNNNSLIGELSLPATTASASAGTTDVDYALNFALPPGGRIIVGLGTTVAAGWAVTAIGGKY